MYDAVPRITPWSVPCARAATARRGLAGELRLHQLRETKVENLHFALARELNVRGLQVPVNDSPLVRCLQSFGYLVKQSAGIVVRDGAARDSLGERLSLDQLHDEETLPPRFLQTMDRRDPRVVQRRGSFASRSTGNALAVVANASGGP
jgi:hypothetical protein